MLDTGTPLGPVGNGDTAPAASISTARLPDLDSAIVATATPSSPAPAKKESSEGAVDDALVPAQTQRPRAPASVANASNLNDAVSQEASAVPPATAVLAVAGHAPAPAETAIAFPARATAASVQVPSQAMPQAAGSAAGAVGSTVLALLLVVGLILALAWLARRMPGAVASSGQSLRVLASLGVGQRERLMVVAVGQTQLLLGVGPGGTRTLHTLTEPLPMPDAPAPFAQLLAQQFGKKKP
ncbi:MAG: flagellar biosynthetic protein FliO [Pseudomonadota bacterium]|nr:flagellar biosynthetic protein FliO [Pseudomonadota bacterium]